MTEFAIRLVADPTVVLAYFSTIMDAVKALESNYGVEDEHGMGLYEIVIA